jgi:hypothetical protein
VSILRTAKRKFDAFTLDNATIPHIESGGKLVPQYRSRDVLRERIWVGYPTYNTTSTSTSGAFSPYLGRSSDSWNSDAEWFGSHTTRDYSAIMVTRTPGDVASFSISNSLALPFSGINNGGATNSFHRLWVHWGRVANPLGQANPHEWSRVGGSNFVTMASFFMVGAAMDRVPGSNHVTAVVSSTSTQFTFPAFQPRNGRSLLLYIASLHNGAGGSPYFSGWNTSGLTRAGGSSTSYTNGFQAGNTAVNWGAVVVQPYRITSQGTALIPAATVNLSSATTGILAIVEIEPSLDWSQL